MTPKYRLSDREPNTWNHPTKFLILSFHKERMWLKLLRVFRIPQLF